jgi:site-specific recombinase XerD
MNEQGNPFVFPGRVPGQLIFNPTRAWRAILNAASIDVKSTSLHTLRHTFASLLVNEGASLHEVANLLGHLGKAQKRPSVMLIWGCHGGARPAPRFQH